MRVSLRSFVVSCVTVAAAAAASGASSRAQQIIPQDAWGFVGDLAVMRDLEPPLAESAKQVGQSVATQSAAQRSAAGTSSELFANTGSVAPLLVGDIEPQRVSYSSMLPMTGRSVGARPSLPWTKPLSSR
jgi:hypothetical protein